MVVSYTLDGTSFRDLGVVVSSSKGLLDAPKRKISEGKDWQEIHGEIVDLDTYIYEARDITLDCFIAGDSSEALSNAMRTFIDLLTAPGLHRLVVNADMAKPLFYQVYLRDQVQVNKKWRDGRNVATFTLKLKEPEPVKRVVLFTGTTCNITLTTQWPVNIYWGDGSYTYDVQGETVSVTKTFATAASRYCIITGNIEQISYFSTNGTLIWGKL